MIAEQDFSAAERDAWRAFWRGTTLVHEQLNQDLVRESGLSIHEYEVLAALHEAAEHRVRMSHLAKALIHSRSRLTHTVRRLEQEGFVKRVKCADAGRGVYCALTKSGRLKFEQAAAAQVAAVRSRLLGKFDDKQVQQLSALFNHILAAQPNDFPEDEICSDAECSATAKDRDFCVSVAEERC